MPSRSKVLGNGAVGRQKTLGMPRGFKPLHAIFPLARWPMRVLTAVIEIPTLTVFHPRQDLPFGRAVALQLIGDDDPWHVLEPLEQLCGKTSSPRAYCAGSAPGYRARYRPDRQRATGNGASR